MAENVSYKMATMENISSANISKEIEITSPTNTLSRSEGIAWSSVFFLFSFFIVVGNLLTIVLFAANKRASKKSLFLVINMAFADLLLGAFCLPVYSYFIISSGYQLSMTNVNWKSNVVYNIRLQHFIRGFTYICSFHIMWEVLRHILAIQTPKSNSSNIPHFHFYIVDAKCPNECYWLRLFKIKQRFHQVCQYIMHFCCNMHHLWMQHRNLEKISTRRRHFTTEEQRRAKCAFDKNFNVCFHT